MEASCQAWMVTRPTRAGPAQNLSRKYGNYNTTTPFYLQMQQFALNKHLKVPPVTLLQENFATIFMFSLFFQFAEKKLTSRKFR